MSELACLHRQIVQESRPTPLLSNFYEMCVAEGRRFHCYSFSMQTRASAAEGRAQRHRLRRVFWRLVADHPRIFHGDMDGVVFDDAHLVFTTFRLWSDQADAPLQEREWLSFSRANPQEPSCTITLKYCKSFAIDPSTKLTPDALQFVNAVVTQCIRLPDSESDKIPWYGADRQFIYLPRLPDRSQSTSRGGPEPVRVIYQPPELGRDLNLYLYRGIIAQVKQSKHNKLVLNTAVINNIIHGLHMDLLDFFVYKICGQNINSDQLPADTKLQPHQVDNFNRQMEGIQLSTKYQPVRHYQFRALSMQTAQTARFQPRDLDRQVSVEEYFANVYQIALRFPKMQLVEAEVKGKNFRALIPMELLKVSLRPTFHKAKLQGQLARQACQRATRAPNDYFNAMQQMVDATGIMFAERGTHQSAMMRAFGVSVAHRLLPVSGRELPQTTTTRSKTLIHRNSETHQITMHVMNCGGLADNMIRDFCERLVREMSRFSRMPFDWSGSVHHMRSLADIHGYMSDCVGSPSSSHKPQHLFLFVLDSRDGQHALHYDEIKRNGDRFVGAFTQCLRGEVLQKLGRNVTFIHNIILKIVTKTGGQCAVVETTSSVANRTFHAMSQDTLYVGVFSSKHGQKQNRPAVLAMSYNIDQEAAVYAGVHQYQEGTSDLFDDFSQCFFRVLQGYADEIGRPPQRVVLLRGGLSASVLDSVFNHEIAHVGLALDHFRASFNYDGWSPQLCYMTVSRAHATRFAKERHNDLQNPRKGTCVSQDVTEFADDFYLNSHDGKLGTSKPAYYRVFLNSIAEATPEVLQVVCNALCDMVGRSSFTVAIPAPLFLADLLSQRCHLYTRGSTDGVDAFKYDNFPLLIQRSTFFS